LTDPLVRLLRDTSRTFYLSLAVLPRPLREPIGLAYLLARASDTVADTRLLPRGERIGHLRTLREAYAGAGADVAAIGRACATAQALGAERELLLRLPEALRRLDALRDADRVAVRAVIATITDGQLFDLERFPGDDASAISALETAEELDRYTYLVAGCVGEFWTRLHVAHRPRLGGWDLASMSARGVRFGKALQLTNVLRDVPADLRHGRCYLPKRELATLGLAPANLLDRAAAARARPVLERFMATALGHYDDAWRYTFAIPRAEWRMRLACAWPLLIGLATLAAVAAHPAPLADDRPIKISRGAVRAIVARATAAVWSNAALRREASRLSSPLRALRDERRV
jgi:farnesyl-diphosphate farnesyltransferase